MVARLSREKGIDRAIIAVSEVLKRNIPIKLHIVGGGAMATELSDLADELDISDNVIFYGEQGNPYRYMKNADLLMITSYHEAAPMVIDEARCLGLPVLTTETTSSHDMVTARGCGWVCNNSQEALTVKLTEIALAKDCVADIKKRLQDEKADNSEAISQFNSII